jgi:hypothetical protein
LHRRTGGGFEELLSRQETAARWSRVACFSAAFALGEDRQQCALGIDLVHLRSMFGSVSVS